MLEENTGSKQQTQAKSPEMAATILVNGGILSCDRQVPAMGQEEEMCPEPATAHGAARTEALSCRLIGIVRLYAQVECIQGSKYGHGHGIGHVHADCNQGRACVHITTPHCTTHVPAQQEAVSSQPREAPLPPTTFLRPTMMCRLPDAPASPHPLTSCAPILGL